MRPIFVISLLVIIILGSCSINYNAKKEFISMSDVYYSLILSGQYILNNQNEDGSLEYLYYPSEQRFSTSNNMIRQFMSTIALAEMYEFTDNDAYKEAFDKNIKFNLENYYAEDNDFGIVFFDNKAKLGAAAFAIISILKNGNEQYNNQLNNLIKTVEFLHNETDGSFRTFYLPKERNDNQYFYPGEAMLALMMLYEETGNEKYLDMIKVSFEFYSEYFRDKMNPAFIPWHTQALYLLYQETKNKTYANYILEINDWLLLIQNKKCDIPGRLGEFYDPNHSEYGPPHASSTAVYVEGLSYAYRLAKEFNDKERMEGYREAMLLGARSLIELQFKDDNIKGRDDVNIVLGGIRTSTDRDEIRIDNNQHTIMAFLGILDTLSKEEVKQFYSSNPQYNCQIG